MSDEKAQSLEKIEALLKEAFRNASDSQRIKLSCELAVIVAECVSSNEEGQP